MITVEKRSYLDCLPNKTEAEYGLVKEDGRMYQYHTQTNTWDPVTINTEGGLQLNLYEINQNIFSQLQPMTDEQLQYAHAEIYKFLGETMTNSLNDYWALICWEKHYVTIFHHTGDGEELSDVFMEIIEELGQIKDISNNEHGAMEIWITDDKSTNCYLLFNYKEGVVEGMA